MIINYFKIAIRSIRKDLFYSLINIIGLGVGIGSFLMIMTYVQYELSYDKYHDKSDRIYRAYMDVSSGSSNLSKIAVTPNILAPLFQQHFGEIEKISRLFDVSMFSPRIVKVGKEIFQEEGFIYGDSSMFDIFTFVPILGDLKSALNRPNTVVITRSISDKYFGTENPIGKTILVSNTTDYEITAVIEDIPPNSHFRYNLIGSFSSISAAKPENYTWGSANYYTYLLLNERTNPAVLEDKFAKLVTEQIGDQLRNSGSWIDYRLQPLADIHLNNELNRDESGGDWKYVYIFSAIAFLILIIACINYMNLATAKSTDRAKEVGMRKMLGARKHQLFSQFIGESLIITLIAIILAILACETFITPFSDLTQRSLSLAYIWEPSGVAGLVILWIVVSLIAGSYPSIALSSFMPATVLKGKFKGSATASNLRRILVIFQFCITIFLISGTIVVYKQLTFIQEKKLGYNNEQVITLPFDRSMLDKFETIKKEFKSNNIIFNVTAGSETPTQIMGGYSFTMEGDPDGEQQETQAVSVDIEYIKTFEIELMAGIDYNEGHAKNEEYEFVINETVLKERNWSLEDAVGKRISLNGRVGPIIGVMKDFHFTSLHRAIGPLVFFYQPSQWNHIMVKVSGNDMPAAISYLETKWKELIPFRPFEYAFLDQEFADLYSTEQKVGQIMGIFSGLAIFIACLGLMGLASFTAAQKSKEIGVRKVMGASILSVIGLLSKQFAVLVIISFIIAAPVSYLLMNSWLDGFEYKIQINVATILVSGLTAFLVAFFSVAYQSFRAAKANPVNTLRYE